MMILNKIALSSLAVVLSCCASCEYLPQSSDLIHKNIFTQQELIGIMYSLGEVKRNPLLASTMYTRRLEAEARRNRAAITYVIPHVDVIGRA